jgi:exonuclease SbcD
MRLLFLSDTHLGFDLPRRPPRPGAGAARPRRGADFFATLEAALAPARRGEVDAVLHGGDLLYRSRVPAWLADAALAPLRQVAESGLPVLLVPGNHERGRMPYPLLALHPRLHLFDRPRTVALEAGGLRVAVSGFPYAQEVRARFPALLAEARRGAPEADLRLVVMHQCVEGATCGPGCFTFRGAPDVVRRADLPRDAAAVLCGHIHRHQVLTGDGPPVVYAGSTERTSAAEAGEEKVALIVELDGGGLAGVRAIPMPERAVPERKRWDGWGKRRATSTSTGTTTSTLTLFPL